MTTKRTPLNRQRTPPIDAEALRVFAELDAVPLASRFNWEFERRAYQLAQRLGLGEEHFCSRCSVLDHDSDPCWPPGYEARDAWFKVRAVRNQLIEATRAD
jgi:hypothetical protein